LNRGGHAPRSERKRAAARTASLTWQSNTPSRGHGTVCPADDGRGPEGGAGDEPALLPGHQRRGAAKRPAMRWLRTPRRIPSCPASAPVHGRPARHLQRDVQVAFLGRRRRHQRDLQVQEEGLTRSHVAARCRDLAAQVTVQSVALADGIGDRSAAPESRGPDAECIRHQRAWMVARARRGARPAGWPLTGGPGPRTRVDRAAPARPHAALLSSGLPQPRTDRKPPA
jgi:hypothetical protein